jgi:SPW repeat
MPSRPDRLGDLEINNLNVLIGTFLFFSPWVFAYRDEQAAPWNAWTSGALLAIVAFSTLFYLKRWEEWLNLLIGSWISVSPWLLGFSHHSTATGIHVIVGIGAGVIALVELWRLYSKR